MRMSRSRMLMHSHVCRITFDHLSCSHSPTLGGIGSETSNLNPTGALIKSYHGIITCGRPMAMAMGQRAGCTCLALFADVRSGLLQKYTSQDVCASQDSRACMSLVGLLRIRGCASQGFCVQSSRLVAPSWRCMHNATTTQSQPSDTSTHVTETALVSSYHLLAAAACPRTGPLAASDYSRREPSSPR